MKIKEIMTKEVEVIHTGDTMKDAAQKMRVRDVGFLPVFEGEQLVGALTDRDIILRSTADGMDPNRRIGRDLVTSPIVYCFEDQDVEDAAKLMEEHQIRRLAVVGLDGKRLVGVVSLGDISRNGTKKTSAKVLQSVSEPTA
jgi:CBS domain-containing protein